jgi:hypothetical protein
MKAYCLLLTLLPLLAYAEDFTLADGTKVSGKVARVEPDGVVIETAGGVEKLPYYALTDADLKRFGLTTKTAEAFRLQQKDVRARQLAEQVAAVQARSAALEKKRQEAPTEAQMKVRLSVAQSAFSAEATVIRGTAEGVRARLTTQRGKAATTMLNKSTLATVQLGEGFIYGVQGAEGDKWRGTLYPAGYHLYTTDIGTTLNIRAYATTVDVAILHGAKGDAKEPGNPESPREKLPGGLRGGTLLDAPKR